MWKREYHNVNEIPHPTWDSTWYWSGFDVQMWDHMQYICITAALKVRKCRLS